LAYKLAPHLTKHGRLVQHNVRTLAASQVDIGTRPLMVHPHVEPSIHPSGTLIVDPLRSQNDFHRHAMQVSMRNFFVRPAVFPKTGATEVLQEKPAHVLQSGRELPKPLDGCIHVAKEMRLADQQDVANAPRVLVRKDPVVLRLPQGDVLDPR